MQLLCLNIIQNLSKNSLKIDGLILYIGGLLEWDKIASMRKGNYIIDIFYLIINQNKNNKYI
jgi:hypothetical protein